MICIIDDFKNIETAYINLRIVNDVLNIHYLYMYVIMYGFYSAFYKMVY